MTTPQIFISYSHADEAWKDRLVTHLKVLQMQDMLDLWDDSRIGGGEDWLPEIEAAMDRATVAILLVSADFLASGFILGKEVPRLLQRREEGGLHVFPVIARPCLWKRVKWLSRMQIRPPKARPLSGGDDNQVDTDLAAIAEEIADIIDRVGRESAPAEHVRAAADATGSSSPVPVNKPAVSSPSDSTATVAPSIVPDQTLRVKLLRILTQRFSSGELQNLCFLLGVNYGEIPGRGISGKARELIGYCQRHNCIPRLVELIRSSRPDIVW